MLEHKILYVLMGLVPWYGDRDDTEAQRRALLQPIAADIAFAVAEKSDGLSPELKASAVMAVGDHESHWARYVIEARCSEGPPGARCDEGLARGPFQQHASACPRAYRHPEGSRESLREEARCAVRLLTGALRRCRGRHPAGDWAGAFSGYRSASCEWKPAARRAQTMNLMYQKLLAVPLAALPPDKKRDGRDKKVLALWIGTR